MDINSILLFIVGILLVVVLVKLIFSSSIIELIVITSVFSLLIGICYLLMDAPDVAMTETALAGCLSTCILLKLLRLINEKELHEQTEKNVHTTLAFILCVVFLVTFSVVIVDLPNYGDALSPVNSYVGKYYIENTKHDIGIPSFVAGILASYRGYDTLGETLVILIAGLGVLMVLNSAKENINK